MNWITTVRVRFKRTGWGWAIYYGKPRWPSFCFWIIPGTLKDLGQN
jgi:hypothetical protein